MEFFVIIFGEYIFTKISKYIHKDKMNNLNYEYHETFAVEDDDDDWDVVVFRNDGFCFNSRMIGVINNRSNIRPNDNRISLYVCGAVNSLRDGIIHNIRTWNIRILRGKVFFLPKRYIFSSGLESLKGYKDLDETYYNNYQNA